MWEQLPFGFLRRKFRSFMRLDYDARKLVIELAYQQKFKCALCSSTRNLIIEHDHEPFEGSGESPTVHNIRGLVCSRCNSDLSVYERYERGEYYGLEYVTPRISSYEYERYIYAYDCRVFSLRELLLERRVPNYWHRRLILLRFDSWYYDGHPPPASWLSYKRNRQLEIKTPEEALRILIACMEFVINERKRNPDFDPPDEFFKMLHVAEPIFDLARAQLVNRSEIART